MSLTALRTFDSTRALQAVAVLLRRQRYRQLSASRLLALLYFADREIIAETGRPIVGGQLRATNRGPLLETMSRLMRGEHVESPRFAHFIVRENHLLQLVDDPGNGRLSRYEIAKLNDVGQRFDANDDWEIVEAAILLPESQRAASRNVSEIAAEDVLEAVGREQEIAMILDDAATDQSATNFFASQAITTAADDAFIDHAVRDRRPPPV